MKIAHIVNPVNVSEESDLYLAQPITFESMRKAKFFSKNKQNISQYVIGYEEDSLVFPENFITLPLLNRSVMDAGVFKKKRKLPCISDILFSLKDVDDIDYIIYTNVDIAVLPQFYDFIFDKVRTGSDSMIINRRVVDELSDLSIMFSTIGKAHSGYDCFVFRKELLDQFILNSVCVGANFIGRAMIANLISFSNQLEIITDKHLTFHIGDDGLWLSDKFSEFDNHNKKEVYVLIKTLISQCDNQSKIDKLNEIIEFMKVFDPNSSSLSKLSFKVRVRNKLIHYLKKI